MISSSMIRKLFMYLFSFESIIMFSLIKLLKKIRRKILNTLSTNCVWAIDNFSWFYCVKLQMKINAQISSSFQLFNMWIGVATTSYCINWRNHTLTHSSDALFPFNLFPFHSCFCSDRFFLFLAELIFEYKWKMLFFVSLSVDFR